MKHRSAPSFGQAPRVIILEAGAAMVAVALGMSVVAVVLEAVGMVVEPANPIEVVENREWLIGLHHRMTPD